MRPESEARLLALFNDRIARFAVSPWREALTRFTRLDPAFAADVQQCELDKARRDFMEETDQKLATLEARNALLEETVRDLVHQFACRTTSNGRRCMTACGLSALECAFHTLGWDDPHYVVDDGGGCMADGCTQWATCGTPTPTGYKHFCDKHYGAATQQERETSNPAEEC